MALGWMTMAIRLDANLTMALGWMTMDDLDHGARLDAKTPPPHFSPTFPTCGIAFLDAGARLAAHPLTFPTLFTRPHKVGASLALTAVPGWLPYPLPFPTTLDPLPGRRVACLDASVNIDSECVLIDADAQRTDGGEYDGRGRRLRLAAGARRRTHGSSLVVAGAAYEVAVAIWWSWRAEERLCTRMREEAAGCSRMVELAGRRTAASTSGAADARCH
eukprot:361321-Chlamydomonas_euryale.AAC.4